MPSLVVLMARRLPEVRRIREERKETDFENKDPVIEGQNWRIGRVVGGLVVGEGGRRGYLFSSQLSILSQILSSHGPTIPSEIRSSLTIFLGFELRRGDNITTHFGGGG